MQEWYTLTEIAKTYGYHPNKVRSWCWQDWLNDRAFTYRAGSRGHWRINKAVFEERMKEGMLT